MNYQKKKQATYNLLNKIKHTSRSGNKRGYVKCWKGTSKAHFMTIAEISYDLINEGFEILTEVEFTNGGRADILAISPNSEFYIIEVLHSETEEMLLKKKDYYPEECLLVSVKAGAYKRDNLIL